MRLAKRCRMRPITTLVLAGLLTGCAHLTTPPKTEMVEVTDGSIVPGPPRHDDTPPSRRRSLITVGGVLIGIGVVTSGIGAGRYVRGAQAPDTLDGLSQGLDKIPGAALLGVGVPTLVCGAVLMAFGFEARD